MVQRVPEEQLQVQATNKAMQLATWLQENPTSKFYVYEIKKRLGITSDKEWRRIKNACIRHRLHVACAKNGSGWHYDPDDNAAITIQKYDLRQTRPRIERLLVSTRIAQEAGFESASIGEVLGLLECVFREGVALVSEMRMRLLEAA